MEKKVGVPLNRKTVFLVGVVVVGLVLIYLLATQLIPRSLVLLTRAAPGKVISFETSTMIGGRILAKSDGEDFCVINVFLRDKQGMSIPSKMVTLAGLDLIEPEEGFSDANGQVTFKVRSKNEGQFKITSSVEGVDMGKEILVTFRESL